MNDLEKHIHSLEKDLAALTIENQKLREDYSKMSREDIVEISKAQLKETAFFFGGWDELRKVIAQLEENDNEAAAERYYSRY